MRHKQSKAERVARKTLVEVFGDLDSIRIPVNIGAVLDYYGLLVKEGIFKDDNVRACIDAKINTIFLSSSLTGSVRSLVTAHEIGHYVMHKKELQVEVLYFGHSVYRDHADIEQEAMEFALSLLLPRELVRRFWGIAPALESVAQAFNVPQTAVALHLRKLSLIT